MNLSRPQLALLVARAVGVGGVGGAAAAWSLQSAASAGDEETRTALTAVKRAIVEGHRTKDRAALDRLYAADYTATDRQGTVRTKADLLNGLPTDPDMARGRYDLIAVRRWGDLAVASGHGHLEYRNPDGTTRVSDYYSFNVFERRDGRWLYVAAYLP
jgi:ketosteroid isomerase-like protein